jgi:hypothetical protein
MQETTCEDDGLSAVVLGLSAKSESHNLAEVSHRDVGELSGGAS